MRYKSISNNWININNLENLPDDTIEIDCTNSYLTSLPFWDNLTKVEIIYCSGNHLTYLPNWKSLINLKKIICFDNKLSSLPEWETLINLEFINCSRNELVTLPDWKLLINLKIIICNENELVTLPNWESLINLNEINCNKNYLSSLPDWNNLYNLEKIGCTDNNLTGLPDWNSLINLKSINCSHNILTSLLEWKSLINLKSIDCSHNNLMNLPEWTTLINLTFIQCMNNNLISLPEWTTLTNLQSIYCSDNNLTVLPNWNNLISLQRLDCHINNIISFPASFGNLNNLIDINYYDNPIEYIPPNIIRRLNRQQNGQNIYNDGQNVHNHNIQESLKKNIINLLQKNPMIDLDECMNEIKEEILVNEIIIEYLKDDTIHTILNVTFADVLLQVWSRIRNHEYKDEIIKILNIEMLDSECKCFTGRLTRLVNCLVGFEEDIIMEIDENEQMSNISKLLYNKYDNKEDYQRELRKEFLERGYSEEDIEKWSNLE